MPRLSETMTEGKLLAWLVEPGQTVAQGEQLAEIEADKANMEIEAPSAGIVKAIYGRPGDTIQVGELMVELDERNKPFVLHGEPGGKSAEPGPSGHAPAEEIRSPLEERLKSFRESGRDEN